MSIIDQLIQIKKSADNSDIVAMLDEFSVYSKLSKIPALSDISKSDALQKQLPLLSKAIDGDIYCLSLYMIASDITTHLGYDIPENITAYINNVPEKLKKRLIVAQENTIKVDYQGLDTYQHELMQDYVVAVYTHEHEEETRIAIIVRWDKGQRVFQGSYVPSGENEQTSGQKQQKAKTLTHTEGDVTVRVKNYSVQGNNAYFFASVDIGQETYSMMIDDRKGLIFHHSRHKSSNFILPLSKIQENQIGMAKSRPVEFIETLASIIQSGCEET